jgi:hypothetical protein
MGVGLCFLAELVHEQPQAAPDRLQQLVVGQNLIAVCHENAHQAECVKTM